MYFYLFFWTFYISPSFFFRLYFPSSFTTAGLSLLACDFICYSIGFIRLRTNALITVFASQSQCGIHQQSSLLRRVFRVCGLFAAAVSRLMPLINHPTVANSAGLDHCVYSFAIYTTTTGWLPIFVRWRISSDSIISPMPPGSFDRKVEKELLLKQCGCASVQTTYGRVDRNFVSVLTAFVAGFDWEQLISCSGVHSFPTHDWGAGASWVQQRPNN